MVLGLVLLSILFPGFVRAETKPKRNFVFVLVDDMGWRDLGCYGSSLYRTPNIDKLAAQGMRFTDAYAACPVCSPTRASILTGKYPARLRLTDWLPGRGDRPDQKLLQPNFQRFLPLEEVTLAEALKPLGYVSASIGKWHLGTEPHYPQRQGFDVNVGGSHAGSPPGGYFGFKIPSPISDFGFRSSDLPVRGDREYLTDRLTQEAEAFIGKNKDRPFFLYLAHYAVHIPLQAKKEIVAKYQVKPEQAQGNPIYAAMIESVDDSVCRIMKKLDDLQIADRTVIFFSSDNGGLHVKEGPNTPATSNIPLRAGKGYLYEGGIRVPLIVKWPGVADSGRICATPVSSVDFYPTILEIADAKLPHPSPTLGRGAGVRDGESLVPLLRRAGDLKRKAIYWHYPHYSNQGGKPGGAVRDGDYKLIEFYEDGRLELYNLKDDIEEKSDRSHQEPERARAMQAKLREWRNSVGAQMPTPNRDYR